MKLTYFGTAAAEGMPALFCNCSYCKEARTLGGKNIRTRSQALINDDLLLDFPADTYFHFLKNGVEGDRIRHLLITHSHPDHFYPEQLELRQSPFAHEMREKKMELYCGEGAFEKLKNALVANSVICQKMTVYQPQRIGNYTVIPLPANHHYGDGAFIYAIKDADGAALLYAHDTGYFYEEVFQYIEKEKLYFNAISYDCTNVDIPSSLKSSHMSIDNILALHERLSKIGAVDKNTTEIINHFSHNAKPLQHILEERVKDYGWLVAYDGMQVQIANKKT
ncbi:MAG: PhnP protein [Clostridia bacterium]|nr:PhnP protein [Clostridia bacterium]